MNLKAPLAAACLAAAAVLSAGTAAQASVGPFDMEQTISGYGTLDMVDQGAGYGLIFGSESTDWSEVSCHIVSGNSWCELKDSQGRCANTGTDYYVYANSCGSDTTPEQWWKTGYVFVNRHYGPLVLSARLNSLSGIWFMQVQNSSQDWATPSS